MFDLQRIIFINKLKIRKKSKENQKLDKFHARPFYKLNYLSLTVQLKKKNSLAFSRTSKGNGITPHYPNEKCVLKHEMKSS